MAKKLSALLLVLALCLGLSAAFAEDFDPAGLLDWYDENPGIWMTVNNDHWDADPESAPTDEDIEANKGKTYQDVTAMADPMAGLFGNESGSSDEGEDRGPFETQDGGKGSGNFGHSGRPGMVGGSGAGGSNKVLTYAQARAKLKSPQGWHSVSDWSRQNLVGHFNGSGEEDDHKADYPGWSISDYQNWSKLLLSHEPDNETLFGVEVGEYRYRFCTFTGDFVKEHMGKGIVTMFRPKSGKGYYERQIG